MLDNDEVYLYGLNEFVTKYINPFDMNNELNHFKLIMC